MSEKITAYNLDKLIKRNNEKNTCNFWTHHFTIILKKY